MRLNGCIVCVSYVLTARAWKLMKEFETVCFVRNTHFSFLCP
jgi:hypothetical protein